MQDEENKQDCAEGIAMASRRGGKTRAVWRQIMQEYAPELASSEIDELESLVFGDERLAMI